MLLVLLACTGTPKETAEPVESEPQVDTVDTSPPEPPEGTVQGSLTLDDGKSTAFAAWHAFSYANGKAAIVYLSSAPDATCEDLTGFLFQQQSPAPLFVAGQCNLQVVSTAPLPLDYDFASGTKSAATYQLNCPFDSGEFSLQGSSWRWSGAWYVGNADGGEAHLAPSGDAVSGTLNLTSFAGSYPYEAGTPKATVTGPLSGNVIAEPCTGLSVHPIFQ